MTAAAAAPDMAAVGGLHVESVGAGPPLVLLHGWAMHGGMFASLLPGLASRHCVHVVDLPGHGLSAPLDPTTLDDMVSAVAAHFGRVSEPLTVLGWSLGGTVALRWAVRMPERLAGLVLVGTTPRFVADPGWPQAMAPETLQRFGDELAVSYRLTLQRFLALQVQGSAEGRSTLAELRRQLFARGEPAPAAIASALAILAAADLRADASRIRMPALVIAGEHDRLTPPAAAAWLARALPDARLVEIPGAGHAPFLSHRAAFECALDGFLNAA